MAFEVKNALANCVLRHELKALAVVLPSDNEMKLGVSRKTSKVQNSTAST